MSWLLTATADRDLALAAWDAENRLTNVARGPAGCDGVASYRYDGDGLRARTDSYCTGPAAPPFRTESYYVTLGGLPRVALERLNGGAGYRRYLYGHGLVGRTVGDPSGYDYAIVRAITIDVPIAGRNNGWGRAPAGSCYGAAPIFTRRLVYVYTGRASTAARW